MKDVTNANFGLLIAYVLPGFVTLWGISLVSGTVRDWLGTSTDQSPTVGGFLYVTLAAVAAGLFVSTIRWAVIDRIHHRTGISEPDWSFSHLNEKLSAFDLLVASHYRYYQCYANGFVAVAFSTTMFVTFGNLANSQVGLVTACIVIVELVLWLGARDTLRKYYRRADALIGKQAVDTVERPGRSHKPRVGVGIEGPFR